MTIDFQCTDCGRRIRATAEHAGKRVRCPGCQSVQQVPSGPTAAAPPSRPAPRPAQPAQPAPRPVPTHDSGFAVNPGASPGGPLVGTNPSVTSRFRKSSRNALQNGIGSLVCAVIGIFANALCCVAPIPTLMGEAALAVIGIMLALNSRSGWKIAGLILNILLLVWTVTIFLMILGGMALSDPRNLR